VSKAFTPRRIKDLEGRIREFSTTLVERAARKGEFEVMADLANPLPMMVIAEMLGIPPDDYEQSKLWSRQMVEIQNVPLIGAEMPEHVVAAGTALRGYFIEEIEKRRRNPGNDLISVLVEARDQAEALTEEDLIITLVLLLLAAHRSTVSSRNTGALARSRRVGGAARERGRAKSDARPHYSSRLKIAASPARPEGRSNKKFNGKFLPPSSQIPSRNTRGTLISQLKSD
jgi:cytochrome P450